MAVRRRLDAELVHRKIARSREQAVELIKNRQVSVQGIVAEKPATQVTSDVSIKVEGTEAVEWASRGAHKLLGAMAAFGPLGLDFTGKKVLDAGASTGGFTDVALRNGAKEVVAVDVGYGQLIWRLHNHPQVRVVDRTNIRYLTVEHCGGQCDLMVGDLSFISLKLVLPAVIACMRPGAELVPMVKPQFEVGKERLGHGGVVRSSMLRAEATTAVAMFAQSLGLSLKSVVASPLPGPSGNVEYFLWLVNDNNASALAQDDVTALVTAAVLEGPQ